MPDTPENTTVETDIPARLDRLPWSHWHARIIFALAGGVGAPLLFDELINTGSRVYVAMGYGLGAALMITGAAFEHFIGVEAAGKSLESISKPLQSSS